MNGGGRAFALGLSDTKVTIYAQQLRGYNLAWALIASGKVTTGSRIAIIGGGAGGLSTAAALTSVAPAQLVLFEGERHLMPLQMNNKSRFIQPNIYEWPTQPESSTAALPDLRWTSDYAGKVREAILRRFSSYESAIDLRLGTKVKSLTVDGGSASVRSFSDKRKRKTETFDVVILCVGFGMEHDLRGQRALSYWSNDAHEQNSRARKHLVIGVGDGGLTDAMRIAVHDLDHRGLLYQFQHDAETISVARRLEAELAAIDEALANGLVSRDEHAERHHRAVAGCPIIDRHCDFLRDHLRQGVSVHITARGHLYSSRASTLNKVIVRHFEAVGAIGWCSASDRAGVGRRANIVYRIGSAREAPDIASGRPVGSEPTLGRRLGTEAMFSSGFFTIRHDIKQVRIDVISARAGDPMRGDHRVGSASMDTYRYIEHELEAWCHHHSNIEIEWRPRTFEAVLEERVLLLRHIEQASRDSDLLLVLGSDVVVPLFGADPASGLDDLAACLGDTPLVFFGAAPLADISILASRNIYVAWQHFDLEALCHCIQSGFANTDLYYLCNPRYPVDTYFFHAMKGLIDRAIPDDPSHFRMHLVPVDERSFTVDDLPEDRIYVGRYLAHHLAFERQLMQQRAFLSSFAVDLTRGAIVVVDSEARHCAKEIAHQLVAPLLTGTAPPRPVVEIRGQAIVISEENARTHGITIGEKMRQTARIIRA